MILIIAVSAAGVDNSAMSQRSQANRVLFMNTFAFTVCFAVWTMYGVLITFLVDHQVLHLDKGQMGWLIGIPVLTGSILRLPVGMLTDRFGGKPVYIGVMLLAAIGAYLTGFANSFTGFMLGGLAFGLSGASFAVGIAYSSVWFPKERQGTALGIFGVGNIGAALTSIGAPLLLKSLTRDGQNVDAWRLLPQIYAGALLATVILFALLAIPKRVEGAGQKTIGQMLHPLRDIRVWRFGLYYFVLFGAFVALSQWLIPYYLNVYGMTLAGAGFLAACFSLPTGLVRAFGGWISDRIGARTTMYWVLSFCVVLFLLLSAPRMEISSPGEGVMADSPGPVTFVSASEVRVGEKPYSLRPPQALRFRDDQLLVLPKLQTWQEPVVSIGETVKRREVLARGTTQIYFQANRWIFTIFALLVGISMGIGMAAVYKHIPEYFPKDVGVVGGLVGVIGGLGGFFLPVIFGYMLKSSGLWTSCWAFLSMLALISLVWMHLVILRMTRGMKPTGPLDQSQAEAK